VCAGVADFLNVDPTIVRLAAVVLAISGPGVPAYVLAWIFLPTGHGATIAASTGPGPNRRDRGTQILGIVLLVVAISVLWGDWWSPARHWLLPLGLIGVGLWLLLRGDDDDDVPPTGDDLSGGSPRLTSATPPPPSAPPAPPPPPPSPAAAAGPEATASVGPEDADATEGFAATDVGGSGPADPWDTTATGDEEPPPPPWSPTVTRRRHMLGPIVFGALLVWGGIAWLADVHVETALAIGLCIVGAGFVLGAFIGGSWALVVPSVLIAGALVMATVVDIPLNGGIGDKRWTVREASQLEDQYELAIGESTLDLRDLDVARGRTVDVAVQQGIGQLRVLVPEDTSVEVHATVSAGQADLLGRSDDGVNVDTGTTVAGSPAHGRIRLELELGLGHIEVDEVERSFPLR
jgi:predicted membrane protein